MTKIKRLSDVSHLGIAELRTFHDRIRALEEHPGRVRSSLSNPKNQALNKVGNKDLIRGVVIAAVGVLALTTPIEVPDLARIAAIVGGALFLTIGIREKAPLAAAVIKARRLRDQIEGTDGFLWRFQTLLEYRDADGPVHIHQSLVESCRASKVGKRRLTRPQLLEYWHWVSMVEFHLSMADAGLHDQRLDPY